VSHVSETGSAAIDPLFDVAAITNEAGQTDYAFYWSSTTHANWTASPGRFGVIEQTLTYGAQRNTIAFDAWPFSPATWAPTRSSPRAKSPTL
jgi:hypothetical protein